LLNLSLKNIHKKYGAHTVLQFDSLELNSGIHWLKGGNGTGKTTLFRIISGQTPFVGEVCLNDINLKKDPISFRSKISYAEAEPQYPLFITGIELISFYSEARNAKQGDVEMLTTLFGMKEFLAQKIGDYSSGMLKKLSLICAFLGDAALYILDEPLIKIDHDSAAKLYKLIADKAQNGASFLLSSHQDIDLVKLKVDSVLEIHDKKVVPC
jgi:ABC-2 type transport system ATP-binding protein